MDPHRRQLALFLYDACTAGEATVPKADRTETRSALTELSGNGSRIVVTAGTAKQRAWVIKESSDSQYSIFTEALLRVLYKGTPDSKARGFITIGQAVEEANVLLADMTRHLGPGHEMNPDPVKIDSAHNGTFVFLYPAADKPELAQSDVLAMGVTVPKGVDPDLDKQRELALWTSIDPLNDAQLYAKFCDDFPAGVFCPVARKKLEKLKAVQAAAPLAQDLTKLTVKELQTLAAGGSRDALTQLGKAYESGLQGAPKDLQASIGFYKRAADMNDGEASYRLGFIYYYGREGVQKNDEQAANWFRKAADTGHAQGMTFLGYMYENGQGGLVKNQSQAVSWYRKAADAGDAHGMANLGIMYEYGKGGLPKDESQAVSWYRKAADAGDGRGMANLGVMYEFGKGELPKDESQALSLYRKAAAAGDGQGMADLGDMYEYGKGGLSKDESQALSWYRKAAEGNSPFGMFNLARMYEYGKGGLPKDKTAAIEWYRKAAQAGNSDASDALKRLN